MNKYGHQITCRNCVSEKEDFPVLAELCPLLHCLPGSEFSVLCYILEDYCRVQNSTKLIVTFNWIIISPCWAEGDASLPLCRYRKELMLASLGRLKTVSVFVNEHYKGRGETPTPVFFK